MFSVHQYFDVISKSLCSDFKTNARGIVVTRSNAHEIYCISYNCFVELQ